MVVMEVCVLVMVVRVTVVTEVRVVVGAWILWFHHSQRHGNEGNQQAWNPMVGHPARAVMTRSGAPLPAATNVAPAMHGLKCNRADQYLVISTHFKKKKDLSMSPFQPQSRNKPTARLRRMVTGFQNVVSFELKIPVRQEDWFEELQIHLLQLRHLKGGTK